jgi:hypothetical protein
MPIWIGLAVTCGLWLPGLVVIGPRSLIHLYMSRGSTNPSQLLKGSLL